MGKAGGRNELWADPALQVGEGRWEQLNGSVIPFI